MRASPVPDSCGKKETPSVQKLLGVVPWLPSPKVHPIRSLHWAPRQDVEVLKLDWWTSCSIINNALPFNSIRKCSPLIGQTFVKEM